MKQINNLEYAPEIRYEIRAKVVGPSLWHDRFDAEVDDYKEAVEIAQRFWKKTGRSTSVSANGITWHRIDHWGVARDINRNSGVPEVEQLERDETIEVFWS